MQFKSGEGQGDGGKAFIKLKDKESIQGVFRGDPHEFKNHWKENRTMLCQGTGCPICATDDKKPSFRFRLNLLVKEADKYVSKIFEQGWTVYLQLKDLHAIYPLDKTVVKITRSGSGVSDTHYSILPLPNGAITPQAEAILAKVPLQILTHDEPRPADSLQSQASVPASNDFFGPSSAPGPNQIPFVTEEDVPF